MDLRELRAGTSGYSYKEWKGPFYPADLPARGMLAYYAERLPAVEINNTFYRMPKASVLEGWAQQVPESFRFVLKASRRITHFKRLKETAEETEYLVRTAAVLGERLGLLLFQLPPNMKKDLERLEHFLDELPEETRAAFEFRHESWFDDDVVECLRARGRALCLADTAETPLGELTATAAYGYLRLRREDYDEAALLDRARQVLRQDWDGSFVFFKHEDAGAGPRLAQRFLELAATAKPRKARPAPARVREAG